MAEQTQTNITAYGRPKSSREGGSTVINYTVNGGGYGSSNINARSATINRIKSELIDTNILNAGTGNLVYLVATDGTISTLRGTDLNYQSGYIDELQTSKIKAHELTMNEPSDIAKITTIFNEYLQGKEIVTDYLTVNKAAHFFEVVIDKIKSVGGTIINTACNSTIDYVQGLNTNDELTDNPIKYRCYFKRTQDDGTHITNDWMVNDQAICQACNLVPGTSYGKGTHYYWRLVVGRNNENAPVYVNFNTGEVDDESITQPDYFVVFKYGEGTSVIFTYDKTIGNDGSTPVKKTVTAYTSTGDIATDMTVTSDGIQLKIEDTIHGLTVLPDEEIVGESTDVDGTATNITQKPVMIGGGDATFSFETMSPTRLNVAFVFDDGTIEFHPIGSIIQENNANHVGDEDYTELNPDTDYLTEYSVGIISEKNINFISITSDEVNVWNSCHYIDLSNETGEYDIPQHIVDNPQESDFNMAPVAGDNIVQLGYRYTELSSADLANLGYDSSSTDAAGQSLTTEYNDAVDKQAWKNAHVDEVSRASAIIIAAYKTPDQGNPIQNIKPVIPPSYAQYQNITDFNLYNYRGTYFDATGAYINGALIAGSTIDASSLDIDVKTYKIISEVNPITRDGNGNLNLGVNSKLDVSFIVMQNGDGTTYSNVPAGMTLRWTTTSSNGTVSAGNHPAITIASNDTEVSLELLTSNNNVADKTVISIIDLGSVTDGKDGAYNQWAYKNNAITPSKPSSDSTYPPSGWTAQPSQPSDGEYTYMITRTVTPRSSSQINYGTWSDPVRITGDDGQPGTDGDFTEFIYTRNNTGTAPSAPPHGTYARDWPNDGTTDHQTVNGITWYDNPQGVTPTMMYEYVSSRQYNGSTETWSDYYTPALWAKWGENGQDGDGVKYIFTKSISAIDAPIFSGNGYPDKAAYRQDTNNNQLRWYDEPLDPNATNDYYGFVSNVLCSQSNTYEVVNGTKFWSAWSTPKTWAMYVTNGENGQPGATGPQGPATDSYQLVPLSEIFEVRLSSSTEKYENLVGRLYTDLKYVIKIDNTDTPTFETDLSGYTMTVTTDAKTAANGQYRTVTPNTGTVTIDGNSVACFRVSAVNLLSLFYSGAKINYYYLHKSGESWEMITRLDIVVKKGDNTIDSRTVELIFKPDHLFSANEYSLQSVYQGLSGQTGTTNWSTGFSQLKQTWDNISATVNNLTTVGTFPESDNLKQYGWYIKQTSSAPSAPTGDLPNSISVTGQWTSYNHPLATSDYAYGFVTYRTRTSYMSGSYMQYSYWSSWTAPQLYYTYAIPNPKLINSAGLDIKANEINLGITTKTNDITNKLYYTGINIRSATQTNPGTITLQADKVTFTTSDGSVNDKISIDPSEGTLNAVNGNFSGTVNAGLFYSGTYSVPNSIMASTTTRHTLRIDPTITDGQWKNTTTSGLYRLPPTTMYFFSDIPHGTSTSDRQTFLELPAASTYDGLEIGVFNLNTTSGYNVIYSQIRIKAASTDYLYAPVGGNNFFTTTVLTDSGRRYMLNQPYTGGSGQSGPYYMRQYPLQYSSGSKGDSLLLFPNVYYKFKAIAGNWYVIDGLFNGE